LKLTTELKTMQAALRSVEKRIGQHSELYVLLLMFTIELQKERGEALLEHLKTLKGNVL
jgi:hypothetical protein